MLKISFLGDISLNNNYSLLAKKSEDPFVEIQSCLANSDYIIGNLEAIAQGEEENKEKQTRLKVSYESLNLLIGLKVNLLTLANNHIYDQLNVGFVKTINFLDNKGIEHTGAFAKGEKNNIEYIKDINGKKIAFLNYVHHCSNPKFPKDCKIDINIYDKQVIIGQIQRLKTHVDYIVLIIHWGMDNSRFPEPWQRKDAQTFIDAGADLIVGHHSHVLQGYENYKNKSIFYSLGNFAFAPLREGKENDLDSRQRDSIILNWLIANNEATSISWYPIKLDGLKVVPARNSKIKRLSVLIPWVSNPIIWPLYKLYLNILYKAYYYFLGNGRNPLQQLKNLNKNKLKRARTLIGLR